MITEFLSKVLQQDWAVPSVQWFQDIDPNLLDLIVRIVIVFGVLIAGRWLAKRTGYWLAKPLQRVPMSETMVNLTITLAHYSILVLTLAIALAVLGFPITVIVSVIVLFLIILAIALQQSLANLAATIYFFLFKPFEVGHLLETCGVMGFVKEIQLLSTVMVGNDFKTYILPNAKIQSQGMTNYSLAGKIRLDMTFRISYKSDVGTAKNALMKIMDEDKRVLSDPPAMVFLKTLGDNGIDLEIRPFIRVDDYFRFQLEIPERVKAEFDAAGIVIPFPQTDVHFYPTETEPLKKKANAV